MKTLKQITTKLNLGGYQPKPENEVKGIEALEVQKTDDANGNGDDVFNATNVKTINRKSERHGHDKGDDEKAYDKVTESFAKFVAEKHLTPAELKKREEIAQAMERENPGMDKSKKMAIATAQAKKVAEEVEAKKAKKGTGVDAAGTPDSIPLSPTVQNEEVDTSVLEFFLSLNEEEQAGFVAMIEEGHLDAFQEILSEDK